MTILGVGMDIVETKRIAESIERFGDRFLHRVFLEGEVAYARSMKFPHLHLAARFAAKEAVSKAFTTGIGAELGWRSVSIYHGSRHEPLVRLDEKGRALLAQVGATDVFVSLSHTVTVATAVAALVRRRG